MLETVLRILPGATSRPRRRTGNSRARGLSRYRGPAGAASGEFVGLGEGEMSSHDILTLLAILISPYHRKHNLPDQLRVRPSSDRSGIA